MSGMIPLPVHPLDAQWVVGDDELESAGVNPALRSGQEDGLTTWFGLGYAQADMSSDLLNGGGFHFPAVHGTGSDGTVDPQLTVFGPSAAEVDWPGTVCDGYYPAAPSQTTPDTFYQAGFGFCGTGFTTSFTSFDAYPDHNACFPAGASIPGAPVSPVAFSPVSHVLDEQDPFDTGNIMAGSPAGTDSSNTFGQVPVTACPRNQQNRTTSFSHDLLGLSFQQAHPGGVGTTTYDSATDSSFALSPGIMTPLSANSMSPSDTPLAFPAEPAIPETPGSGTSDQDNESSSSDTSKPKEYRCNFPNCKSKKRVFELACQLRKHQKNHSRPNKCPYCKTFKGGAEPKDLARHLRKAHSDLPQVRNDKRIWKEMVRCPRCAKDMRVDNRNRHLKTCVGGAAGRPR